MAFCARRRPSDGGENLCGAPQSECVIGYGRERGKSQLALIRLHEKLDSAADAALLFDALRKLLVKVFFEIIERMEPVRVFGQTRSVEVVLVDKPNENRLAAFSVP
jgi:hypothetical protein